MHALHEYIAKQIADKVKAKRVVVIYDPASELSLFFQELEPASVDRTAHNDAFPNLVQNVIGGTTAWVAEYDGSFLELRASVEPLTCADELEPVVIYLPGCRRDDKASLLLELELAGERYEPQLKRLARNVLSQRYTAGVVDELLAPDKVSYEDLVRAASSSGAAEAPSPLKVVFHGVAGNEKLIAEWLATEQRDADIVAKNAVPELCKLIRSRLGLELQDEAPVAKLRSITARYVLANEFRGDLNGEPPASLDAIAKPKTKDEGEAVRALARDLRASFANAYAAIADRVQDELGLRSATIAADRLGSIDTFRFEERALLTHCGGLIADKKFADALKIVTERENSFWLEREVTRKAQWEACRRMANLGTVATEALVSVRKLGTDAAAWINAYTAHDGLHRMDQAQRHLETWIATLDDDPEERGLAIVRRAYDDACHAMADGFTKALTKAQWSVPSILHQTRVYQDVVADRPKPVAYFLVDAMRFEMGAELADRLPRSCEVSLRPAIVALPSITTIGMAALLPGAAASFDVVEQSKKLGARINDSFLPDLGARKKLAAARVPNLVDIALDELMFLSNAKLTKKVAGAQVVVVRSQEIDLVGESGLPHQARQVMSSVIENLANAIRKLAAAGVPHAVVSADHGHLFHASDRDDSMKIDAPGGDQVELHRRCWIGRGGTTPPGCVRVAASALGYRSDLDLVFPSGCGVFKAGGDLAFHHGGPSLQEMIVPVLTVVTKVRDSARPNAGPITVVGVPEAITNRIFTVKLQLGGKNLAMFGTAMVVRPLLIAGGKQVGTIGMANAELDRTTHCVTLEPNKEVTAAFQLNDDSVASVRVVVQDPATDAELYRSSTDIPVRLLGA